MDVVPDLGQLLVDIREEVKSLGFRATEARIEYVHEILDRVVAASEDLTTWITEPEAMLKSGLSERTLRRRFREMIDCGTARYGKNGRREFLSKCIPQSANVIAARARGRGGRGQ